MNAEFQMADREREGCAPTPARRATGSVGRTTGRAGRGLLAGFAILTATACDSLPLAMGDVHAVVVTGSPELWAEVGEEAFSALEGNVFTVRNEHAFRVSYLEPADSSWAGLRRLRQLLFIGKPHDPWMATPLAGVEGPLTPPTIAQVQEVWAREQLVTLLLLEEDAGPEEDADVVRQMLPELFGIFEGQFREWAVARMFATGADTALARTVREEHGFSLTVPEVYDYWVQDSVHVFRNDNPDPSELIRQFAVTWRSPIADGGSAILDGGSPSAEDGSPGAEDGVRERILAWRSQIVDQYYEYPQVVNLERLREGRAEYGGRPGHYVQAVWQNPPDGYPAAGPFISRAIACAGQDRLYLIDAWLYAPTRDKYEYMIQLDEIMNSFSCEE